MSASEPSAGSPQKIPQPLGTNFGGGRFDVLSTCGRRRPPIRHGEKPVAEGGRRLEARVSLDVWSVRPRPSVTVGARVAVYPPTRYLTQTVATGAGRDGQPVNDAEGETRDG